jgi:hypothetical protein
MSKTQQIIENISKNNLVEAKQLIEQSLLSRLGNILESKIEEIAPSMVQESGKYESESNEKEDMSKPKKRYIETDDKKKKKKKSENMDESTSSTVDPEEDESDNFDADFEDFVDQIQEIVQEIEQETGEELTEEEIIALGKEYLSLLNEEFESEVELEDEIEDEDVIEEKKDLPGNQEAIDVAEPKGTINGADFKKLRSMGGKK